MAWRWGAEESRQAVLPAAAPMWTELAGERAAPAAAGSGRTSGVNAACPGYGLPHGAHAGCLLNKASAAVLHTWYLHAGGGRRQSQARARWKLHALAQTEQVQRQQGERHRTGHLACCCAAYPVCNQHATGADHGQPCTCTYGKAWIHRFTFESQAKLPRRCQLTPRRRRQSGPSRRSGLRSAPTAPWWGRSRWGCARSLRGVEQCK